MINDTTNKKFEQFYNDNFIRFLRYSKKIIDVRKLSGQQDVIYEPDELAIEAISQCYYEDENCTPEDVKKRIMSLLHAESAYTVRHGQPVKMEHICRDKRCSKCKLMKSEMEFRISNWNGISFLMAYCKPCERDYVKQYQKNPLVREKIKKYMASYYLDHKETILNRNREWSKNNKAKVAENMRKMRERKKNKLL